MASVSKREWTYKGETKTAWVVRYVDQNGIRRMKTFDKNKDANRFRANAEVEIERGVHVAGGATISVEKLCDEYMKSREDMVKAGTLRETTLVNTRVTVDNDIVPFFGAMKVADIRYEHIEGYHRWMRDKRKLHPGTAADRMWRFRKMFEYACKKRYAARADVMEAISEFAIGSYAPVEQFTAEQVSHLLGVAAVRPPRAKLRPSALTNCAVNLAVFGGLRVGEILGLTLNCVDEIEGCIRVAASLNKLKKLTDPKTRAAIRTVYLPARVMQLLADFRLAYYVPNGANLLFTTGSGEPMMMGSWTEIYWSPLLVRAGLKDAIKGKGLHFHALRHFHASWLLDQNEPVTSVSARIGHADPAITMKVYAHAIRRAEEARPVVERMSSQFGPRHGNNVDASRAQQISQVIEKQGV